ncbi:MAG: hypothetical protein RL033_5443 [Pseudomonadota bacterium]|jgi:hypothetical protein
MASQHDPSESAEAIHAAARDAHRHGENETLAAARKTEHRRRVRAFAPLFVTLLAATAFWNRVTDPHFAGFRPIDGLRLLAVALGVGGSVTGLWQLFVKRRA